MMLGLGLESVGYSSVKSELHSDGQAESFAQPTGKVEKTIRFTGLALSAALILGYAQADFFSPGDAKARSLAENTERLLKRNSQGAADAHAYLTGWQEAIVTVEPQEAVALATIIGLPDGYYGEGSAEAGASIWAAPNKVQRSRGNSSSATATAIGDEHVTRNAYAQPVVFASAYGEWQLNSELFATGHAQPSAALQSQAYVYPSLEPLIGGCVAHGSARVRFRESSTAIIAAAAETLACEHRKGGQGEVLAAAGANGKIERQILFEGHDALANSYVSAFVLRSLLPAASLIAEAGADGAAVRQVHAAAKIAGSMCEATAVPVRLFTGRVLVRATAQLDGGLKLNDYSPAPDWRRLIIDSRPAEVVVEQATREMVV